MVTGSVGKALVTSVETWFAAIEEVKRSGAVSPATRATAITTPVRMPPIAVGRMMLTVVRQRVTPSARLASRRLRGTISSTSCVARATMGSISTASENAPKIALWPRPTTSKPKTKMPTTIAGTPFRTSSTIRSATETRGPAYSDMKMATRMLNGIAITIAMPTTRMLPTSASAIPPACAEERPWLGEEVEAQLAEAPVDHRPEHEREDADRQHGARNGKSRGNLLGDPAAAEVARADRDVVPVAGNARHQYALRDRSNRVTITCATTFVTREMTIRIAPR